MTPRTRASLRWMVAIALVVLLLVVIDIGEIARLLASTDMLLALPAIAGLVSVHVIAAASWRRLTATLAGTQLDWATSIRLYYAALAFGTVTPANLGADVYRVTALGHRAAFGRLTRAVVVQRLTSIMAVVYLGLVGALALPIDGLGPFVLLLGGVGAATGIAIVILSASPGRFGTVIGTLQRRLGLDERDTFQGRFRGALVDGFGFGLAFHGASLFLGFVLVGAVDARVAAEQPVVVFAALAVARFSLALPISPNGIGVQEGLLAVLFLQVGLPAETAVAAALLNRLALVVAASIGAITLSTGNQARPAFIARR